MPWNLRYASHLGYRSVEEPLFKFSVNSPDPVGHIEHAAALGFSGVQYALAVTRPVDEQRRVGQALSRLGLEAGCMLWAGFDKIVVPIWGDTGREARDLIHGELRSCAEAAKRVGARHVAVIGAADPKSPLRLQQAGYVDNLRWAAEFAEKEGLVLCVESLSRRSLAGMLAHHIADAYAIVRAVGSPAVKLIFDTSHVQAMDGDLLANLAATWDAVAIVQLADNPGRFEPESGEINFANVLTAIHQRNFRGLVELEHLWSGPGAASEAKLVDDLRRMDSTLGAQRKDAPAGSGDRG